MKKAITTFFLAFCAFLGIAAQGAAGSNNEAPLKVMSFNIRFWTPTDTGDLAWPKRIAPISRVIHEQQPDLIGFQEPREQMWQQLIDILPEYSVYRVVAGDELPDAETGRIMIAYNRNRFLKQAAGRFWLNEHPETPGPAWRTTEHGKRACLWVKLLDRSTGKQFYFATTHFPYKTGKVEDEARSNCSRLIISRMKAIAGNKATIFLTGDFNAANDKNSKRLPGIEPMFSWFKGARDVAPVTDDHCSFNGFGRVRDGKRGGSLDHIFFRNATPLKFQTIDGHNYGVKYVSDHYPIVCTFTY